MDSLSCIRSQPRAFQSWPCSVHAIGQIAQINRQVDIVFALHQQVVSCRAARVARDEFFHADDFRANELPPDVTEYGDLELALTALNQGQKLDVPGIRH